MTSSSNLHRFYASVGGNLTGSRDAFLRLWESLCDCFLNLQCSQLYRTTPQDKTDQPDFFNWVFGADTTMSSKIVLNQLSTLETELGRVRGEAKGPRLIDIDLLLYTGDVLNTKPLTIPHPRMHQRAFALVPLLEISPGATDPVSRQAYAQFLSDLPDQGIYSLGVYPYNQ